MKHKSFFIAMAAAFVLTATNAGAGPRVELPRDWQNIYTSQPAWQVACDDGAAKNAAACDSRSLVYFKSDSATPTAEDMIVRFEPRGPARFYLQIAPYEGRCTGGSVSIDGPHPFNLIGDTKTEMIDITLQQVTNSCQPERGRIFQNFKQENGTGLKMDWLKGGGVMRISIDLADGGTLTRTVPLDGFADAFDRIVKFEEANMKHGRGRVRARHR